MEMDEEVTNGVDEQERFIDWLILRHLPQKK
jgi:hypothetical protein